MTIELAPGEFSIEISRADDGSSTVVQVTGNVDLDTVRVLGDVLDLAAERGQQIVVDLTGAEFISAAGISLLVRAAAHARSGHGALRVRNPPPMAARAFESLSLAGDLPIEVEGVDLWAARYLDSF